MKQFKKILSIMLVFVMGLALNGCGNKTPSDTVKTYMEEAKKGESGNLASLLGQTMDAEESAEDDKDQDETTKKMLNTLKKLTYTINSENINGDSATVNVTVNGPDLSAVMQEYMQRSMEDVFSNIFGDDFMDGDKQQDKSDKILSECLENVNYTERTGSLTLKKSGEEWKIESQEKLAGLLFNLNSSGVDGNNGGSGMPEEVPENSDEEI